MHGVIDTLRPACTLLQVRCLVLSQTYVDRFQSGSPLQIQISHFEFKMEQSTINQRLKFLLKELGLSARAFSEVIGESPTNTQNYVGTRGAEPRASYIQNILRHFNSINAQWLLMGEGEPFLGDKTEAGVSQKGSFNQTGNSNIQKVKGNKNNLQTNNGDHATITNNIELDNCQRDLEASRKEVALLTSQLADKERTIQILLKQQP